MNSNNGWGKKAPDWYIKELESRLTPKQRAEALELAQTIPLAKGFLDSVENDYPLKINPYPKK